MELILIHIVLSIVSAILVYGMTLAYYTREYPELNKDEDFEMDERYAVLTAFITFLFYPVALPLYFILSSFAKHGLKFKK